MNKRFLVTAAALAIAGAVTGQEIKGHYVSKAEEDGIIYHTLPSTLFENREMGDLTFDITYKSGADAKATLNFSCQMQGSAPADSVHFTSGPTQIRGEVTKLYITPEKKLWKHRYTMPAAVKAFYVFFDDSVQPTVTIYSQGKSVVYKAKPSAWKSYAPIGYKIFEMIRINE